MEREGWIDNSSCRETAQLVCVCVCVCRVDVAGMRATAKYEGLKVAAERQCVDDSRAKAISYQDRLERLRASLTARCEACQIG